MLFPAQSCRSYCSPRSMRVKNSEQLVSCATLFELRHKQHATLKLAHNTTTTMSPTHCPELSNCTHSYTVVEVYSCTHSCTDRYTVVRIIVQLYRQVYSCTHSCTALHAAAAQLQQYSYQMQQNVLYCMSRLYTRTHARTHARARTQIHTHTY